MFILRVKKNNALSIVFYRSHFEDFISKQNEYVKKKIFWVLDLIRDLPRIPDTYFKLVNPANRIYEIRVHVSGSSIRIFCFFETNNTLVLINSFHKKTQKTPVKEIEKAIKLKIQYETEKGTADHP